MHPRPESARRRLSELAERTHQEVEQLEERRGRLARELSTIDVKLVALRADLKGTLDRLYGTAGAGGGVTREPRGENAPSLAERVEPDDVAQDEPVTEDDVSRARNAVLRPSEPADAGAAATLVEGSAPGDTPRGIFEVPVDQWTDLQLAWMVMTPTMLKTWTAVCAIRGVIGRLGGAASRKDIAADLHERGYAYTVDQVADTLSSSYFRLGPDHLWRAVTTGPVMTPTRRAIAERWLTIIKIIDRSGGKARWRQVYNGLIDELGTDATRNRVNHALRDGPFHQDRDGFYRFAPASIRIEEPDPD